jgi:peptidyl-tRNA hydrolase, PTH1 family
VKAVVGLRNPGPDYEATRHNIGYDVVVALAGDQGETLRPGPSRLRCEVAQIGVGDERFLLAAPVTYMNESGSAVRALLDYFSVETDDLLVVHDDIDLPFGRLRLRIGGGTGGHNGLRSLEKALGTREFGRLKVGVGRPPGRMDPADFVLRRFTNAERVEMDLLVPDAVGVVERWFSDAESAVQLAATRGA